jgi:trans-aconitate 2-methyltransferase
VLRPGGRLVAQCGAEGNISRLIEAVRTTGLERTGAWYYASPEDTRRRLQASGFTDIEVWTHPEPTPIEPAVLGTYLETVCLRTLVAPMAPHERASFLEAVAGALGEPVIDYVRLNISAHRTG